MLKKVQVIILPAKEETQSYITLLHGKLYLNDKLHGYDTIQKTQHLYFLSDEEIKEGDWYLWYYQGNTILRCNSDLEAKLFKENNADKVSNKIIATTDSSLKQLIPYSEKEGIEEIYPQPSQSFLEAFVKEYNKGNVIKEVMVEYEDKGWEDWMGDNENGEPIWIEDFKLKVNSKDNTITIKKVKDSWNREEVIQKLQSFADDCENNNNLICYNGKINGKKNWEQTDLAKWIEQNL